MGVRIPQSPLLTAPRRAPRHIWLRTEPRRCDRHAPIAPWVPSIHLGFRFPARRPQGRRFGEKLLLDALRRAVDAASIIGRTGVIVDAMDEEAERFYARYDFATVSGEGWPRRMFLPIGTARAAFDDGGAPEVSEDGCRPSRKRSSTESADVGEHGAAGGQAPSPGGPVKNC
jgi:hypothetical protein